MFRSRFVGLLFAGGLLATLAQAQSGEIRILCSNGIRAAVEQVKPEVEKAIGHKLSIEFSSSAALKKEIEGGATFDLAILTPGIIDDLAKAGKVAAGSKTDIASVDLGVGIKAGSAKTNIGTADGMKKRLLAAKTITWTEGGAASGANVALLKGLGIEEQMKPKIVLQKNAGRPAESVAEGENELVFAPVSEIQSAKGVQVLGVFPPEYQQPLFMTAGIAAQSTDAKSAQAVVTFLTSAKATSAIKAAGLKPVAKK